jgi:hypothetical protein
MSAASTVIDFIKSTPYLVRMSLSLSWMYANLGRQVRKARRAFEKQLVMQGMAREDAVRLSACFEELKNSVTTMLKQGIAGGLRS